MNKYGVLAPTEEEYLMFDKNGFTIPENEGFHEVFGIAVLRYWGRKGNLVLLIDSIHDGKLMFSFWKKNGDYTVEAKTKSNLELLSAEKDVGTGDLIRIVYERGKTANYTRIRELEIVHKGEGRNG